MSLENIHVQPFQAKWNANNEHLKEPGLLSVRGIAGLAWNAVSVIIFPIGIVRVIAHLVISRFLFASAHEVLHSGNTSSGHMGYESLETRTSDWERIGEGGDKSKYKFESRTIRTPDGVDLHVMIARWKGQKEDVIPTLVYFPIGGELSNIHSTRLWPIFYAYTNNIPCNFVCFDQRGVGLSGGGSFPTTNEWILDGDAVVQWIHQEVGTPKEQIHFYGECLGAAYAAEVQALDPELTGHHMNARSFASLRAVVTQICGRVLAAIVDMMGYRLEPLAALERIQGRKIVIGNDRDDTFGEAASLFAQAAESIEHLEVSALDDERYGTLYNHPHTASFEYCKPLRNQWLGPWLFGESAPA